MQRPDQETVETVIPNPHRVLAMGVLLPLHLLSSPYWKIFFNFSIGPWLLVLTEGTGAHQLALPGSLRHTLHSREHLVLSGSRYGR